MDGWIKLHRKMLDNPIVCKDSDHLAVWIYLLMNATHKDYPAMFGGKKMILQPGQLITGRKSISEQLNISESKTKRILIAFETDQQIDRQRSNKNSLISILNWEKYQMSDQQNDHELTSKRPASDQQVTTNKNVKKEKNEKKDIIYTPEFEKFWEVYPKQVGKPAAFNNFKKLLKKHDAEYLIACAMNYASHCLANGTDKQYIKMPNNFLNAKDEYYTQFETPVLVHSKPKQQQKGNPQLNRLQEMYFEEEEKRAQNGGY